MVFLEIFLVFMNVRDTFKHITGRTGKYIIFPEQWSTACFPINPSYQSNSSLLLKEYSACLSLNPQDYAIGHPSIKICMVYKKCFVFSVSVLYLSYYEQCSRQFSYLNRLNVVSNLAWH